MSFLILLLLLAVAGGFVAYPLLRQRKVAIQEEDEELDSLASQKDATYSAIKELEFDYQIGNLSPEDHKDLEEKYKHKAASLLMKLDAQQENRRSNVEDRIEGEVMARRRSGRSLVACPNCGAEITALAKFCSQCGSSLSLGCPGCGASYVKGDRFCSRCGATLEGRKV